MLQKRLKNQDLELFKKEGFEDIGNLPIDEIGDCMNELAVLQKNLDLQMSSLFDLYHEGKTGEVLGFGMANTRKHGLDCKHVELPLFLEVKSTSLRSRNNRVTLDYAVSFSNTSKEKVEAFMYDNVFLAVSVWDDMNDMMYMLFGHTKEIGKDFSQKVDKNTADFAVKTITLIKRYGFKIIAVSKDKKEVAALFTQHHPLAFKDYKLDEQILNIEEFNLEQYTKNMVYQASTSDYFQNEGYKTSEELQFDKISKVLNKLVEIQKRYGFDDMKNSLFSFYHDAQTGKVLDYNLVNMNKHGIDCKHKNVPLFLEVKSSQWSENGLGANVSFSRIGIEKAKIYEDKKLFLAISVWDDMNNMAFIIHGQNGFICDKIKRLIDQNNGERHTVTFKLSSFISQYGFKIVAVSKTKDEIKDMIASANPAIAKQINFDNVIIDLKDFNLGSQSAFARRLFIVILSS